MLILKREENVLDPVLSTQNAVVTKSRRVCLKSIIKRDHFVSNEEVLRRSNVEDIEIFIAKSKLRWLCHVARMDDSRHVKNVAIRRKN